MKTSFNSQKENPKRTKIHQKFATPGELVVLGQRILAKVNGLGLLLALLASSQALTGQLGYDI